MPTLNQLIPNIPLTNISVQFKNPGYLADQIAPTIPVVYESAPYYTYDYSRFDVPDAKRAPTADYARVEYKVDKSSTYTCEEYGLEQLIDDRQRKNTPAPLDADVDTTEIVTDMLLNNVENAVSTPLTALATYAATNKKDYSALPAAQWNAGATSTPLEDVTITGREAIRSLTGLYPNTLILGATVLAVLRQHPQIKEMVKYSQLGIVTEELLAKFFGVERVLVGLSMRNTAKEGQTVTLGDNWGKHAVLAYVNTRPAIKQPSLMYTFQSQPRKVYKYREDKKNSDCIRVSQILDPRIVAAACGYLFYSVVA